MARKNNDDSEAFSKHAQEDTALAAPAEEAGGGQKKGVTFLGKVFVFVIFPVTVGVIGLYTSYLETRRMPDKTLSFDRDFMVPFLLALAMSVVIGIQTGGFSSTKVKPLVAWPKVRKVKKIIKKKKGDTTSDEDGDQVVSDKKND